LNISQKVLAQRINEKQSILQDFEAGKANPNPQILSKLERALGVKLRGISFISNTPSHIIDPLSGTDIGKKLEGPKKA